MGLVRRSILVALAGAALLAAPAAASGGRGHGHGGLQKIRHFVVIYEENHSFDNLYGGWERRRRPRRRRSGAHDAGQPGRLRRSVPAAERRQPDLAAADGGLHDTQPTAFTSHFPNAPFTIDDYIAPEDTTCPAPGVSAPNGVLEGQRPAGRLHARPRAPLLPGAVPAQRRPAGPLRDRLRRRRPDDGQLRHARAADLRVPARAAASRLRDLGPLLPGGLRRLVPQPPVARRRGDADVLRRAARRRRQTTCTRRSTRTGCRTPIRSTRRPAPCKDARADRAVRLAASRRARLRRLRRQHDPAAVPAVCAGHRRSAPAPAADGRHDRRPAEREGHRLGLVLRRLVERQRRRRRTRLDERHTPGSLHRPRDGGRRGLPELPQQAVPVPPPAAQLLRDLRAGHGARGDAPA